MYTVKQVAALTGVSEATLRVWERRYGVVHPQRSDSGYRLYGDEELVRLREMARLVSEGVPASRAAEVVSREGAAGAVGEVPLPGEDDLVQAAATLDPARLEAVIEAAFAAAPFDVVADQWLRPQLGRLGQAWAEGDLSVAQEHFASAALMRAISQAWEQSPPVAPGAPAVVVGLPAGDRHELALLAFATCLLRRGVEVVYLGADVPTSEWVQVVRQRAARGVVLGVTEERFVLEAQRIVDQVASLTPPVAVWAGGSRRHAVQRAHLLPDALGEAATAVHLSLVAGGS